MRFMISRASSYGFHDEERPPHEAAESDGRSWYIEIASLEELMALVAAHGAIIIDDVHHGQPNIRIYDDYIE